MNTAQAEWAINRLRIILTRRIEGAEAFEVFAQSIEDGDLADHLSETEAAAVADMRVMNLKTMDRTRQVLDVIGGPLEEPPAPEPA